VLTKLLVIYTARRQVISAASHTCVTISIRFGRFRHKLNWRFLTGLPTLVRCNVHPVWLWSPDMSQRNRDQVSTTARSACTKYDRSEDTRVSCELLPWETSVNLFLLPCTRSSNIQYEVMTASYEARDTGCAHWAPVTNWQTDGPLNGTNRTHSVRCRVISADDARTWRVLWVYTDRRRRREVILWEHRHRNTLLGLAVTQNTCHTIYTCQPTAARTVVMGCVKKIKRLQRHCWRLMF